MESSNMENSGQHPTHKKHHELLIKVIFYFMIAVVIVFALWFVDSKVFLRQSTGYQAIFLTNGQVYFGHAQKDLRGEFIRLTDVYYLQISQAEQLVDTEATTQDSQFALIKLGKEIHGPKDAMLINRDQVLFIEDLRADSDVVKSIEAYEQ